MTGGWQVGIDVGGTFTDVVAFDLDTKAVRAAKVRSRPEDPLAGLLAALSAVNLSWGEVADLMHGTTLVTNSIIEGKLAKVVLVSTAGFGDTLAIGRQNRRHLYRLDLPPKLAPQVPEERRVEVRERLTVDGSVLVELSSAAVEEMARAVEAHRPEAVAVCLLHAYANPAHEETVGERLRTVVPYVSLSHRVNPEAREYERTSATVLNAGVMPLVARYVDQLEASKPSGTRLHLLHSAGGMAPPEALKERPLALALSGPAAGTAAAAQIAGELGLDQVISLDMGGTSTDVCLVIDGRAEVRADHFVAERPLRQPMVAIESIGAGGGSIARLETGGVRVGPESAGADPGPACYGQGGSRPTVTDANLVLGYLSEAGLLGGQIRLDPEAARRALAPLASELRVKMSELAFGIHRIANANMMRALRRVTVERGIDARGCTLIAFGGAGPLHAVGLAREFGISRIVVPRLSSVFSAFGCVAAELNYSQQQTVRMASTDWDSARLVEVRSHLLEQLSAPLRGAVHDADKLVVEEVAAIRYAGQSYAVDVPYEAPPDPEKLGRDFRATHQRLYGFATDEPWELQAIRLRVSTPERLRFDGVTTGGPDSSAKPVSTTPCWFSPDEPVPTPRYDRSRLPGEWRTAGPAIVEDDWSTVLVPPETTAWIGAGGHLHLATEDNP